MTRTEPVIRLVGGPRKLDGVDLRRIRSPHDRADVDGDRFVRAVRGSTVMSLAARCGSAAPTGRPPRSWPSDWGCAVFAYGRDRLVRTRYFRYQATYRLQPSRDAAAVAGALDARPSLTTDDRRGHRPRADAPPDRTTRSHRRVGHARGRGRRGRGPGSPRSPRLLPDGPLAERAELDGRAVVRRLRDRRGPAVQRGRHGRPRLAARRRR